MSIRHVPLDRPFHVPRVKYECVGIGVDDSLQKYVLLACCFHELPLFLGLTLADARKLAEELDQCIAWCDADTERN